MKKFIFILVVLCALLPLTTCQTVSSVFQEPVVSLHSMGITGISFNGVQFICKVQVQNPNAFSIPFPETDWEFFVNTNSFIKGTVKNNQQIGAKRSTIVDIPISLDYLEVLNSFRSLWGSRQAGYRAALDIKIPLPILGNKVWKLEHSGNFPIPQVPQVSSPSMRVDNVSITGAEVVVTLNFVNPNAFALPSPKITYNYMVNRNSFIRGTIENQQPLAPSSTTPISFRMLVNYADLFRTFTSLLTASQAASLLTLSCDFGVPIFSGQNVNLELTGTLPLR
ncbi:MAG: LEA type 2 family protein [Treponema sp.]|nr:LEA type 2 family protein [Treponema sp.]